MLQGLLTGLLAGKSKNLEDKLKNAQYDSTVQSGNCQSGTPSGEVRQMVIQRDKQAMNMAMKYLVYVDGKEAAVLSNGGSATVTVNPTAEVKIAGKGLKNVGVTLRIQPGANPKIFFTTQYGGAVSATTEDMVVLESRSGL